MKKLFFLIVTLSVLGVTSEAKAELNPRTVIKCDNKPEVYFVGTAPTKSLGLFRDELAFLSRGYTWKDIVTVSCSEINDRKKESGFVVLKFNEVKLLKFSGAPEVYQHRIDPRSCAFVSSRTYNGSNCHPSYYQHIESEQAAEFWFGKNWQSLIVEIPASYKNRLQLQPSNKTRFIFR